MFFPEDEFEDSYNKKPDIHRNAFFHCGKATAYLNTWKSIIKFKDRVYLNERSSLMSFNQKETIQLPMAAMSSTARTGV